MIFLGFDVDPPARHAKPLGWFKVCRRLIKSLALLTVRLRLAGNMGSVQYRGVRGEFSMTRDESCRDIVRTLYIGVVRTSTSRPLWRVRGCSSSFPALALWPFSRNYTKQDGS